MWKKLIHARHLRKSASNEQPAQESKTGDLAGGSHYQDITNLGGPISSPFPVEYTASPPTELPQSGICSVAPIEYTASPPTMTPFDTHGISRPPPTSTYPSNDPCITELPAVRSPAELPTSYPPQTQLIELPASPIPVRHELANITIPRLTATSPSSNTTTNNTKNNSSKPFSPSSATTAPLLDRSGVAPSSLSTAMRSEISVSKCTVQIFCQRKQNAPLSRREELPRDIREFRLAKLALIPVAAGQRRFASLDVVFGKVDEELASLLEKHFSITSNTTLSRLSGVDIADGEGVRVISPLTVAYVGDTSLVYVIFRSVEEETKFLADFNLIKEFIMDC